MRTIYIVGKTLKFKKGKDGLPVHENFSAKEVLASLAVDEDSPVIPLRVFDDYEKAQNNARDQDADSQDFFERGSITPVYTVKLPEGKTSIIYTDLSHHSCAYVSNIARNVVEAQFYEFCDKVELPRQKKWADCVAYFESIIAKKQGKGFTSVSLPELSPAEVYPMLSVVFDQLYPSGELSTREAEIFYETASEIVRQQADKLHEANCNWAIVWTALCCLPLITLPFVMLIYVGIFNNLEENDPIQAKHIYLGGEGTLSKLAKLEQGDTVKKDKLFNKHGELRKVKDEFGKWVCSLRQIKKYGFYSRDELEMREVVLDGQGMAYRPL